MAIAKGMKVFMFVLLAAGLFASGYFWALREMDRGPSGSAKAADMKNTEGMGGMEGMAPGTVMISPDKQQLVGVRTAVVERKPLNRTVRTVGTVTYDETKLTRIHSKIEGWVEKLYVNYTGKLVERGQPLFTIYSPDLLATQQEYLLALKFQERLAASSLPEVRSG
ncbi:MAG: efflux RND transporter periplasmic adaptor subunit, partial [Thermodesulfobacteriota bacterium]